MRSFLVLIFVVATAFICAAQSEDRHDYGTVKLRHVELGQGGNKVAADEVVGPDDNKSKVAERWGIKLKPSKPVEEAHNELKKLVNTLEDQLQQEGPDRVPSYMIRVMIDRADQLFAKIGFSIDVVELKEKYDACKKLFKE